MNPPMDVTELKPHLVYELIDSLYKRCIARGPKRQYFDTIIHIDPMINVAMSGPSELSMFVRFIKFNFTLCYERSGIRFRRSERQPVLESVNFNVMKAFFSTTCRILISNFPSNDTLCRNLASLNDVWFLDLTHLGCQPKKFLQFANIFAKVTNLDVHADVLVSLIDNTSISFPELKCLNISGALSSVCGVKTTPDRFPILANLEIVTNSFQKSNSLKFAEDSFPTIKTLVIDITERPCYESFFPHYVERVANWLKSFTSLTTANIVIQKCLENYSCYYLENHHTLRMHNAFKQTDFGVPLELTFKLKFKTLTIRKRKTDMEEKSKYKNAEQHIKEKVPFFTRILSVDCTTFVYKDEMPGKKFQQIVTDDYQGF